MVGDSGLAVLEARFSSWSNSTVKYFYDCLFESVFNYPSTYFYEQFNGAESFENAFVRAAATPGIRVVVVASHGCKTGLEMPDGSILKKKDIAAVISALGQVDFCNIEGLYFSACDLRKRYNGSDDFIASLFRANKRLKWVAAYAETIDFIRSNAVDIFYVHSYLRAREECGPKQSAIMASSDVETFMPGAFRELKLQVFIRHKGKVKGLLGTK